MSSPSRVFKKYPKPKKFTSHKAGNRPAQSLRALLPLLSSAVQLVKTKLYLSGLGFSMNFFFCLKTVGENFIVFSS